MLNWPTSPYPQTLCSLVRGLYRKMQGDYGFDFINILIGFDAAEEQMQLLLNHCSNFLTGGVG